jgi:hypothetical protein
MSYEFLQLSSLLWNRVWHKFFVPLPTPYWTLEDNTALAHDTGYSSYVKLWIYSTSKKIAFVTDGQVARSLEQHLTWQIQFCLWPSVWELFDTPSIFQREVGEVLVVAGRAKARRQVWRGMQYMRSQKEITSYLIVLHSDGSLVSLMFTHV